MIARPGIQVYTQFANISPPEPQAAYKSKLVDRGLRALAHGDWLAVAVITAIVTKEADDA
jgi:hypothetical protein